MSAMNLNSYSSYWNSFVAHSHSLYKFCHEADFIASPTMWNDNTIGVLLPFHIFHISILHSVKPYGETAVEREREKEETSGKKGVRNSFSRWMGYNHKVESISANTHTHRNIDGMDVFVLQQLPSRLARHVRIVGSAFVAFHPAQYTLEGNYPI